MQRLRARRVEFPGFAETGVRRAAPVPGGEVVLDIDLVLVAIGFTGVESDDPLYAQLGLELGSARDACRSTARSRRLGRASSPPATACAAPT